MADVTKIKLPDNSEYNLKDHRIPGVDTTPTSGSDNVVTSGGVYSKINEVIGTYGNAKIFYGTCSSSGSATAKVVTCDAFTSSDLVKGALIFVTFNETNSGAVGSISLNVNNTGAKHITKLYNTTANPNLTSAGELKANKTYLFGYDGTYWVCLTLDYNNSYSSMSSAEITAGTGTSARVITPANLKTAIETWSIQANWNELNDEHPSYIQNKPTIPSKVSDLTNDLGFTSNTGTLTGITMNGVSKGTSGVVDLGNVVTSETDPVFSESVAAGITSADISKWNSAGNAKIFYGTCTGDPAYVNKTVICPEFTSEDLVKGALVFVTFSNTNTADEEDIMLGVNGTGYKPIRVQYAESNSISYLRYKSALRGNCTYLFNYDGTNWLLLTTDSDRDTVPSIITQAEAEAGTSILQRTISPASLKRDIEYRMAQNQADWNVTDTTSPKYIANKPNIPTTLDQIADGATRKLSNYLSIAGGTMSDDAEVEFTDGGDHTVTITPNSINLHNADETWRIVVDSSAPGIQVGDEDFDTFTLYSQYGITNKISGNTTYNLDFPNKNGTFALTSDIPSAVTESTVSGWGFTKNTGTYSKPSGGIPATDLESTVQTSLGKADTALQSFTETDPTVPSWAKQSTKPTYTASEVGALPDTTVIPTVPTNVSAFTNDVNYVKYVLCNNEDAYNAISNKDSGTLYLIPVT